MYGVIPSSPVREGLVRAERCVQDPGRLRIREAATNGDCHSPTLFRSGRSLQLAVVNKTYACTVE
jgi:hypothetical protein